ncbi:MAG: Cobalt-zinc-cadmium resistance protein CzcB [Nitrospirae bacterium]|nr:MAG: putative cation efflux system protein CzcB [Nitrospira sp. OLB3]MBV6469772.1 Cobalt-zinc-cadmium resistance protein CzcB [Nitrospirota bacterium]MCE7964544.1 efflux RND transporter periplasmic adaptor subunit [Nitrospira sp. NTP2]MCK6492479.1 efflux RND transporter periplasmic adaptor subunit [Nitrospira sp.]MEB2339618.1 efflux RND transporter periplasmic adaptor subunit [Nitrospirales bacterium]
MSGRRTIIPSCILFLLPFLGACGDQEPRTPASVPAPSTTTGERAQAVIQPPAAVRNHLRIEPVRPQVVPDVITAPGEVALDLKQVAKVTSRIMGQIETIHRRLGDQVRVGQPLADILSLQLDQLIEEYLVGKAQADVAEDTYRRTEQLRKDDIVTERRLIEDRGRYLETKARYQHIREKLLNMGLSRKDLKELEEGLHEQGHRYRVTAPIAGTIVAQQAVLGQGVAAGEPLFEIVDTGRVWVFANLPLEQARRFTLGDIGRITPKGGETVTAPLTYLAPVADETTRTIRLRFEVVNEQSRLKPHEYVDVTLSRPAPPVLAVPLSAVTTVEQQRGLFVEQDQGYSFRPISGGREGGGWIEITSGVAEGERVVVDGVFDLKTLLLKSQIDSGE